MSEVTPRRDAGLDAVFSPHRVAVVGASETPGHVGAVLWDNLASFPGDVVPVSRTAATVGGVAAVTSLRDVPGTVDLAVVAVPARAAVDVVRDAAAAGVRACVVLGAGFAETGPEGLRLQIDLVAAARAGGVRVVGPNCLGVQNWDLPLNASLAPGAALGGGGISLVTQSGSYAMALHDLGVDAGIRVAKAVSAGNKADVTDHELLAYLGADPATSVVCCFLESFSDGREFLRTVREVTAAKPVVVTVVGRSEAGSRAAASHAAALAVRRPVWGGVLEHVGATVARSGLEMLDAARALAVRPLPRGTRVGIVTNSGGIGTELTDLLADEGLVVPQLSAQLRARLAEHLPVFASTANPVDITPVWSRFAELYPLVVQMLARSGEVDVVVPVLLYRAASDPDVVAAVAGAVKALRADAVAVPVYVCWVAGHDAAPNMAALHAQDVACFEWPARTARAVGHAVRFAENRRVVGALGPLDLPAPAELPALVGADALSTAAFLADRGTPLVPTTRCSTDAEALAAAEELGYPVVAKVDHAELSHKSDVGGVRAGIADPATLRSAAEDLLALRPGARLLLQPVRSGVELVVGGLRDPVLGPLVGVGLGGVLVEVLGDMVFAPAPLRPGEAARLLDRLRGRQVLDGVRGAPAVDRDALACLLDTVGQIVAAHPQIAELDLNPVLAGPDGVVAVDWRLARR